MARYAMIQNGVVINVCEWDGDDQSWAPPGGITMVLSEEAEPGDTYDENGQVLAKPEPEPVIPEPNVNGFLLAAMSIFDPDPVQSLIKGNTVMSTWTTFTRALDGNNYAVARMVMGLALQAGDLTQDWYNSLEALMTEYHIP